MGSSGLVVVGASAGGLEPLKNVLGRIPPEFAAAMLVVVHLPAEGDTTRLPQILNRESQLGVRLAEDGDRLERRQC
jgi:two-component system, chemotaxis family, protein-glutamate methylesterase/glutaminase